MFLLKHKMLSPLVCFTDGNRLLQTNRSHANMPEKADKRPLEEIPMCVVVSLLFCVACDVNYYICKKWFATEPEFLRMF